MISQGCAPRALLLCHGVAVRQDLADDQVAVNVDAELLLEVPHQPTLRGEESVAALTELLLGIQVRHQEQRNRLGEAGLNAFGPRHVRPGQHLAGLVVAEFVVCLGHDDAVLGGDVQDLSDVRVEYFVVGVWMILVSISD